MVVLEQYGETCAFGGLVVSHGVQSETHLATIPRFGWTEEISSEQFIEDSLGNTLLVRENELTQPHEHNFG